MITTPVEVQVPIHESEREKTFDIPKSVLYRVEVKTSEGITKVIETRAYTKSIAVGVDGRISIEIGAKSDRIRCRRVMYPYHYFHIGKENVLCALKKYDMETMADNTSKVVALNYNLFCLSWKFCVILHDAGSGLAAFVTSREEWDRGDIGVQNQEVQAFLRVPIERSIPVNMMKLILSSGVAKWVADAEAEFHRKKK